MLKKIYLNIGASLVFRALGVIMSLLLNYIIARTTGAEGYGLFYQGLALFTILTSVFGFGLDNFTLIQISTYRANKSFINIGLHLRNNIKFITPILIIVSLVLYFFSDWLSIFYYKDPSISSPLKLFSLGILPFVALQINSESLKGLLRIKEASFLQGFLPYCLAVLAGSAGYFLFKKEVSTYILGFSLGLWIIFIISIVLLYDNFKIKPTSIVEHKFSFLKVFKASKIFWSITSLSIISVHVVTLLLGYFFDSETVGIYGIAAKVSFVISFILPSINSAMAPEFVSSIVNNDFNTLDKLAKKSSLIMTAISIPMILVFILFSEELMAVFGDKFRSGYMLLIILSLGQLVNAITGSVGHILMSARLEHYMLKSLILAFIVSIFLFIVLVPKFGIVGAAVAVSISIALQNIYATYICYRELSVIPLFFVKRRENV